MTEAKNNVISLERTGARTILPSSPSQDFSISRLHPPKRTKKMCVSCVCEGEDTLNKGQAKGKMVLAPVRSREITFSMSPSSRQSQPHPSVTCWPLLILFRRNSQRRAPNLPTRSGLLRKQRLMTWSLFEPLSSSRMLYSSLTVPFWSGSLL